MFKILVIDDDNAVRSLLHDALVSSGYDCLLVANAAGGLKACAREKPDLVVVDVQLPDGSGIEVCRKIKADEELRRIPVLIVSGHVSNVESRLEGLEAGAEDYVIKPFSVQEFMARITDILGKAQPRKKP